MSVSLRYDTVQGPRLIMKGTLLLLCCHLASPGQMRLGINGPDFHNGLYMYNS